MGRDPDCKCGKGGEEGIKPIKKPSFLWNLSMKLIILEMSVVASTLLGTDHGTQMEPVLT